jgi:hypothetical protein
VGKWIYWLLYDMQLYLLTMLTIAECLGHIRCEIENQASVGGDCDMFGCCVTSVLRSSPIGLQFMVLVGPVIGPFT